MTSGAGPWLSPNLNGYPLSWQGGCSGFQHSFSFDDTRNDDDTVIEKNGVTAVIDEVSMGLLAGSEIDYVEEMIGASFAIRNPNATSSCGCGNSFSLG